MSSKSGNSVSDALNSAALVNVNGFMNKESAQNIEDLRAGFEQDETPVLTVPSI